jgi:phage gp45-like
MATRFSPDRPHLDIRRIVGKVPVVRQAWRAVQTMIGWGTVRMRKGERGRQWAQITRGQHELYGEAYLAEPQGFTAGVNPGAIGVVLKPGNRGERVIVINPSRYQQRPRYVDDEGVCLYTPHQSRLFLDEHGDVELGAGLSDYRETPDFLDEGAKVRLRHDGELEVYSETEIRLRCQPEGGEGASATIVMRPDGTLEVSADGDVSVSAAGSVSVSSEQDVSVEALGNITLTPDAGGEVRLGGDEGLQALALANKVKTELETLAMAFNQHVHPETGVKTEAPIPFPGLIPVQIGDVGATNAKAKAG